MRLALIENEARIRQAERGIWWRGWVATVACGSNSLKWANPVGFKPG